jgi:hypothetical protein
MFSQEKIPVTERKLLSVQNLFSQGKQLLSWLVTGSNYCQIPDVRRIGRKQKFHVTGIKFMSQ